LSRDRTSLFLALGVALRLPIWIFKKIQIGGKEQWHTTTERQSADGGSGKKKKKRFYGSAALMKKRCKR